MEHLAILWFAVSPCIGCRSTHAQVNLSDTPMENVYLHFDKPFYTATKPGRYRFIVEDIDESGSLRSKVFIKAIR